MLSSRPQHAFYVDKENNTTAAPSRKATGLSSLGQGSLLKTPGAKQQHQNQYGAAKTVKASSSKHALESTQLKDRKMAGLATIALEPGARVLGTKDGNNRGLQQTGGSRAGPTAGKGKGKAHDALYDDCSLMPTLSTSQKPKALEAPKSSKKAAVSFTSGPSKNLLTAKTPARQTAKSSPRNAGQDAAAFKTPKDDLPRTLRRASPGQNTLVPSFSAFKTPSPNQLLRRRRGGGSPVPFHFNPTSLRLDGSEDQIESKPPEPTLLEKLDAYHATIDDTQEVDCATRQRIDPDDIPVDPGFEMPNYKESDPIGVGFAVFAATNVSPFSHIDETPPISYDDSDMHLRDYIYEVEWQHEPLFVLESSSKHLQKASTQTGTLPSDKRMNAFGPGTAKTAIQRPLANQRSLTNPPTGIRKEFSITSTNARKATAPSSKPSSTVRTTVKKPAEATANRSLTGPKFRLKPSDLPEVVDFDIGELELML